jgi:hypothetical protein
MQGYLTVSRLLVLLAVIIFVLAAFGVSFGAVALVPLGLAVWAAGQLVP